MFDTYIFYDTQQSIKDAFNDLICAFGSLSAALVYCKIGKHFVGCKCNRKSSIRLHVWLKIQLLAIENLCRIRSVLQFSLAPLLNTAGYFPMPMISNQESCCITLDRFCFNKLL